MKTFSNSLDTLVRWLLAPSTPDRLDYALTELELALRDRGHDVATSRMAAHGRALPRIDNRTP